MWVRSEYAGELAVLSTWLCALLPWNVSYIGEIQLFRFYFQYVRFQFIRLLDLGEVAVPYLLVHRAPAFPESDTVAFGYRLWLLGAAVFTVPLALSVAYYVYDDRLEARFPVHPARVLGGLLVVAAVPYTAATYYVLAGFSGLAVPVGVPFMYLLGGTLLVAELTPGESA